MANRNSTNPVVVGFVPEDTATVSSNGLIVGFTPEDATSLATQYLVVGWIPSPDIIPERVVGGASSFQGGLVGSFNRNWRKSE
jgi:hypothetical protein